MAYEIVLDNSTAPSSHSSDPKVVGQPMFANNSCSPIFPNETSISGIFLPDNTLSEAHSHI